MFVETYKVLDDAEARARRLTAKTQPAKKMVHAVSPEKRELARRQIAEILDYFFERPTAWSIACRLVMQLDEQTCSADQVALVIEETVDSYREAVADKVVKSLKNRLCSVWETL